MSTPLDAWVRSLSNYDYEQLADMRRRLIQTMHEMEMKIQVISERMRDMA